MHHGATKDKPISTPKQRIEDYGAIVPTPVSTPTSNNISDRSKQSVDTSTSDTLHVSTPQTNTGIVTTQSVNQAATEQNVVITPTPVVPPAITRVRDDPIVNVRREADVQTAEALLELHETLDLPANNILADYDNSDIMPVNAPPVPDYSKDYPLPANIYDTNADDTVEYADEDENAEKNREAPDPPGAGDQPTLTHEQSPPGRFKFRHHSI